ncbi:DctP family TRAP transporter solute-binding subunit [Rathayibacter sp. VKM Ac-2803]|uniref:TRAP transporter substrate-binding protein n=1 Tax=unclassified Rathayibacter TaxID=2609250 RepID=UPI00135C43F9|nr:MULTISPECIES: TRAP transporter substrate-binding protein [unclassified Rathayibacter]MWV47778.1 DctP family TRAP transporter solute-binding subunit [Rathayibacter sp. VKM Ac-2803]MWV59011.1 DctP family TRAP transporter solute-binding subunit [Rathayibacter sp. VKM Ac-2754]
MRKSTRLLTTVSIAAVASLGLAACSGAGEEESSGGGGGESRTLRLALNQTEEHPSYIALEAMGERLDEATDGRWSIQVYPNETLGAQAETLQLVGDGSVDMAIVSGPQLENLSSDFLVYDLPTVFDSIEHQMTVVNDSPDLTDELYTSLEESNNLTVVGGFTQGARSVYTKDGPAEEPADLSGLKIRVQESPLFISLIEALDASPTPLAFGEVYTGLQSGVIDGAENNEVSYFTQKHYEVAPYFSYTRHLIGLDYLIGNTGVLDEMSEEDRAAFTEAWGETWQQHTELWNEATESAITDATAAGATFTEVDSEAFADAISPLLDEFITDERQEQLFDEARAAAE